jgi:hypothetical protein
LICRKKKTIKCIIATKYSRVLVYIGNINNIVGIIYTKNLAVAWYNSGIIVLEDLLMIYLKGIIILRLMLNFEIVQQNSWIRRENKLSELFHRNTRCGFEESK